MSIKAVIFDMDGVLLDSMGYHVQAWQRTFKPLGLDISSYEVYSREGEDWRKTTRDFLKRAGQRPTPSLVSKFFSKRSRIFKEIFKPRIFKGARYLLVSLKRKGLKLGLVTATPGEDVEKMLPPSITGSALHEIDLRAVDYSDLKIDYSDLSTSINLCNLLFNLCNQGLHEFREALLPVCLMLWFAEAIQKKANPTRSLIARP